MKNDFEIDLHEALEHVVGPYLEEVWDYNERKKFNYDTGTMGGVTGDAFILTTYEQPTEQSRRANPNSRGEIRIQLLGSEQCYPSWDPIDTRVLTSMRIETLYYDDRNQLSQTDAQDKANHVGRQLYVKRFTQIITPSVIIEQYEGAQPIHRDNVLGEIPIVHIRNLPIPREYYGLADLDGLVDLQRELNEKSTDVSDIIAYQAAPVTVITGAKAGQLERGARMIWSGLPEGATVKNLSLESDLGASYSYLGYIKQALLELGETPAVMLETPPVSNTSGAALAMQYAPILDKTARKQPQYERGYEEINYFVLRIATVLGHLHLPYDLCKTCGGRIVELLEEKGPFPRTVRKCFRIDPNDFTFLSPDDVEIAHVRQHSFGTETRSDPHRQVVKEHGQVNPSYWDPEAQESQEEKEERERAVVDQQAQSSLDASESQRKVVESDKRALEDDKRAAKPPPKNGWPGGRAPGAQKKQLKTDVPGPARAAQSVGLPPQPPQMPGPINLPAEPEPVILSTVWTNPTTGEQVRIERKLMLLIPTRCENPQYLDPFSTTVRFSPAIPRDIHLDATLHQQYLGMGLVSKGWVRRQSKPLSPDDVREMDEEIREEKREEAEYAQQLGEGDPAAAGAPGGKGEDGALATGQTELQGMELQRKLGAIGGKISKPPSGKEAQQ